MGFRNLVDVFEKHNSSDNKGITFIYGENKEKFISYHDLYIDALEILHTIQNINIKTGDELIFQVDSNFDFICTFWACLLGKIIPVPVTIGTNDEHKLKLFNIWKVLKNPYLITSEINMERLEIFAKTKNLDNVFAEMKRGAIFFEDIKKNGGRGRISFPDKNDVAYIQFSSGSTGDPKGVILTHKNLITNINAIIKGLKSPDKGERFFSWMPLTHDMGIIGFHLTPLVANWNQFLMPTELFIRYPGLWLNKASEHKISLTVSPNFGYKYVLKHFKREKYSNLDLSSMRLIVNGAEPISAELCEEFLETMVPYGLKRNAMFPVYGLAEASLAVSFSEPEHEIVVVNINRDSLNLGKKVRVKKKCQKTVSFVEVGSPIKDCFVRVVDGYDNTIEGEVIGHIQIKGNNVTAGYYNNKEVTSKTITYDGWVKTGDLGFIKKGKLFITGRAKDILFVNGQNYYPHDIERVGEEIEGIEMGKIAAAGYFNEKSMKDEIIVFLLFRGNIKKFIPIALKLKKHINKKMGLDIENIIPVSRIPKTTSGKIQRYKLVKMFQVGQFERIIQDIKDILLVKSSAQNIELPLNQTEKTLLKIWKEVLEINEIGITENFFGMGGNSLKAVFMAGRIAKEFNVELQLEQIFNKQTIKNIAIEIFFFCVVKVYLKMFG